MSKTKRIDFYRELKSKIEKRQARIAIVGIGYVGLPLSVAFAQAGFRVTGIDIDKKRVAKLAKGESDIADVPSATLSKLVRSGKFAATTDFDSLREADCISICVPTPLRKTKDPDISYIVAATDELTKRARPGQLIVLESTTYPGTTKEVVLPRLEAAGQKLDESVFLAFSPERVDPGNKKFGIKNTPKVVGGLSEKSTELAALYYGSAIESIVRVSSAEAAELVKLLENTFRAVNIGLVNEIALVCNKLKIDVWEVIRAAASKPFGYMPFYPGPGLGGHCIPIDPHYLAWKLRAFDYRVRFIELADDVNRSMPEYVVTRTAEALNEGSRALKGSRILLVGMAYKKDVGDVRESPALDIAKLLRERGAEVSFYDPFVPAISIDGRELPRVAKLDAKALKRFAATLITTNHSQIDYKTLVRHAALVVDTRNATAGFEKLGHVTKI